MLVRRRRPREPDVFRRSRWVRVDDGGILIARVHLGDEVHRGMLLGTVTDPVSNDRHEVHAPFAGVVVGMALDQVVIPGFAAFHLGIRGAEQGLVPGEETEDWGPEAPEGSEFDAGERPE
jgi:predicted deacylase